MAIFQYWVKKTGDWEEVASKALNLIFIFLNAVKVTVYAGLFLLYFSLSQKSVCFILLQCTSVRIKLKKLCSLLSVFLYIHTHTQSLV